MFQILQQFALLTNDLRYRYPHSRMSTHCHDPQIEQNWTTDGKVQMALVNP